MQTDQSVKRLRQRLSEVFPLSPAPERRISDAITCDNWGVSPEDWPEENWSNWNEIPFELLSKGECLLTYFDGSNLVYFLPRFIGQFLDEVEAGVDSFSNPTDSLFMHLTGWRRKNYEGIPFTAEQRQLVEEIFALGGTFQDLQLTIEDA